MSALADFQLAFFGDSLTDNGTTFETTGAVLAQPCAGGFGYAGVFQRSGLC
jgi:phospholipase/lecithinase/hemolysin